MGCWRRGGRIERGVLRRLAWPAATTLALLALTVSLGIWQLQRLQWKRSLLADIEIGETSGPVPLTGHPPAFRRVFVAGTFLPGVSRYGAEVRQGADGPAMGAHLLSVLRSDAVESIVVDRGWAPDGFEAAPPSGKVSLSGYIRPPELAPSWGPGNDEPARRFFSLDPAAIGRSLGQASVAPFTLVEMGDDKTIPRKATALPRPPNDHLSYAVTWFALSAVLVGGFAIYARQVWHAG